MIFDIPEEHPEITNSATVPINKDCIIPTKDPKIEALREKAINHSTKVSILGTEYNIFLTSDEDIFPILKNANGYMDDTVKEIVVKDKFGENEFGNPHALILKNIRHEILHAFMYESGLDFDSAKCGAWAVFEEQIDFYAIQYPKIKTAIDEVTAWYISNIGI